MERLATFCAGTRMTLVADLCLAASLCLEFAHSPWALDPAWLTVIISGIPLVYLSVTRLVHNSGMRKISSALLITIAMAAAIFIGDIFAGGEVAFIMAIGAILEEKTTERAQTGLRALLGLVPKKGSLRAARCARARHRPWPRPAEAHAWGGLWKMLQAAPKPGMWARRSSQCKSQLARVTMTR